jgi:hypothetical protein
MKNLKIKFLPYEKFKQNSLRTVLKDLKENTIIIIDAKLDSDEEFFIIRETMKRVSNDFSGIELGSLELKLNAKTGAVGRALDSVKTGLVERMTGKKRGMTIIGPAALVHKIKKNPEDILLYM